MMTLLLYYVSTGYPSGLLSGTEEIRLFIKYMWKKDPYLSPPSLLRNYKKYKYTGGNIDGTKLIE